MTPDEKARFQARMFTRRALIVGSVQLAGFAALAARLYQIQVKDESRYGQLADTNRISTQIVPPPRRGRIVDRTGVVLAGGEEAFRATFTPALARDPEAVLRLVARVVPLDEREIDRLIARARRQRPNEPMILASDLAFEDVASIGLLAPQLPGVSTELAERRIYPKGSGTGHIVGHVGHVEQVAIDDDPMLRMPWIRGGLSGLERYMNPSLAGKSGRVKLEVDAKGRIIGEIERIEAVSGSDVVSTIDWVLQEKVAAHLAGERCAAAVVLDVRGGDVVAMVSVPGFDPSAIVDGMSVQDWRRLAGAKDDPMLDRATAGQYPPGSTFKMVTALAALEAGVTDYRQRIVCHGSYALGGQVYRCWNRGGHGRLDLVGALRESCDVHFYELAHRVGIDRIAAMARRLGIGQAFECGLPAGRAGVVPDRDWKIGALGRSWYPGETLHAAIGQGYVLATPLQLAVMTARIATGRAVMPRLCLSAECAAGAPASLGLDGGALELVRRGMVAAVNDGGGTARRAQLEEGGVTVAGKTGTAQVSRASARRRDGALAWELTDHALFVAYAPAEAPRYAVAVIVEHGGSGGSVAAPLASAIMADALGRDPAARPPISLASAGSGGASR
ncbi:MAG: penicillin-binding protein 2 [Hyphomicrobiaceae bacterium]|nr:penicillin-binding protein 2 [Hyphomicrobiaceae bacterium]